MDEKLEKHGKADLSFLRKILLETTRAAKDDTRIEISTNLDTPLKINMEPNNQPIEKENHLPNLHFWVPCSDRIISCFQDVAFISTWAPGHQEKFNHLQAPTLEFLDLGWIFTNGNPQQMVRFGSFKFHVKTL